MLEKGIMMWLSLVLATSLIHINPVIGQSFTEDNIDKIIRSSSIVADLMEANYNCNDEDLTLIVAEFAKHFPEYLIMQNGCKTVAYIEFMKNLNAYHKSSLEDDLKQITQKQKTFYNSEADRLNNFVIPIGYKIQKFEL